MKGVEKPDDVAVDLMKPNVETEKTKNDESGIDVLEQGLLKKFRHKASLYQEVRRPMMSAFFMFLLADVRQMALDGKLEGDPEMIRKVIDLPMTMREFMTVYRKNQEVISKYIESEDRYKMYAEFVEDAAESPGFQEKFSDSHLQDLERVILYHYDDEKAEEECVYGITVNHILKRISISFRGSVTPKDFCQDAKALFTPIPNPVRIPDPDSHEVNPGLLRRIKGSITDMVSIHLGFREYLYGVQNMSLLPNFVKHSYLKGTELAHGAAESVSKATGTVVGGVTKATENVVDGAAKVTETIVGNLSAMKDSSQKISKQDPKDSFQEDHNSSPKQEPEVQLKQESGGTSKQETGKVVEEGLREEEWEERKRYQVILEMLAVLLDKSPGYELYISGHSLGGALATLFAFEAGASMDPRIPKPVTCITTGSPKVGNLDFKHSFEALQELGKIRYLRVANYRDVVTLSPPNGSYLCYGLCAQKRRFRHVGMRLRLLPHGYQIDYAPKTLSFCGVFLYDLKKIIRHYFYLIVVCPIVIFCKRRYIYKAFRSEHTQLAYMDRFDAVKGYLEKLTLDDIYKERLEKAAWRQPVLYYEPRVVKKADDKSNALRQVENIFDF